MDPLGGAVLILLMLLVSAVVLSGMTMRHYRLRETRQHREKIETMAAKRDEALDQRETLSFQADIEKARTRRAEVALEKRRLDDAE